MIGVKPPSGTRDFLAADLRRRRKVISLIQEVYESFGFEPLETPAFENLSTLLGKYGEEGDQLLFRILKRGEKLQRVVSSPQPEQNELSDLALRYDLTVPLARVMARYGSQLPQYYKRYQIQSVWRADRPAKGRFREFMQCDLDVCGSTDPVVEAEVLAAGCQIYERLELPDFSISLNHREILRGLIEVAGIGPELEATALVAVDKLDKIGAEGVTQELVDRGVTQKGARRLLEILDETGRESGNSRRIEALGKTLKRDAALAALENLATILELLPARDADQRVAIVPSLARGLSYYTGAIFEAVVPDSSGSVGGGGRYDELLKLFIGRDIPACGFSIGLDRLMVLLEERGFFDDGEAAIDIMFTNFSDTLAATLALANDIRAQGFSCEVFPDRKSLKQQFNYAAARQAKYVAFYGESEKNAGQVRFKRQSDGQEIVLKLDSLPGQLESLKRS